MCYDGVCKRDKGIDILYTNGFDILEPKSLIVPITSYTNYFIKVDLRMTKTIPPCIESIQVTYY